MNVLLQGVVSCQKCKKQVVWLTSRNGKGVLVNANTYKGEFLYNPSIHKCHWDECKSFASRFHKPKLYQGY